ncbi:MAG TPA: OsmC family protein, partial [Actinomycetota bacterium]
MSDPASIKTAIDSAVEYLTANPADARSTDSLATARLLDGLRFKVTDPQGRSVTTDMVEGVGGEDSAPSPGWLLRAAVASCDATLIAMHAAREGITLSRLEVDVDSESNDLGILGIDPSVPKGPLQMRARVRVASPEADDARLR